MVVTVYDDITDQQDLTPSAALASVQHSLLYAYSAGILGEGSRAWCLA